LEQGRRRLWLGERFGSVPPGSHTTGRSAVPEQRGAAGPPAPAGRCPRGHAHGLRGTRARARRLRAAAGLVTAAATQRVGDPSDAAVPPATPHKSSTESLRWRWKRNRKESQLKDMRSSKDAPITAVGRDPQVRSRCWLSNVGTSFRCH
jgi:hypothetical protein